MTTEERVGSDADHARWAKWDDLRARQEKATTDEEREALAAEEEKLRQEGVSELLLQDMLIGQKEWYWLSFADGDLPEGEQFLGVAVVEAGGIMEAALVAKEHGCNPGGEVQGIAIPPEHVPDEQYRYRLMSKAELEEAGLA